MDRLESEKSVLGAIFLDNKAYWKVTHLKPVNFSDSRHRVIFATIQKMIKNNISIDLTTITAELQNEDSLSASGGVIYLGELLDFVPTATNIKHYAKQVEKEFRDRSFLDLLSETVNHSGETEERMSFLEAGIAKIKGNNTQDNTLIKDELKEVMAWIEDRYRNKGQLIGIKTSLPKLDQFSLGFCPGDLIIAGARPSVGKTAFGLQVARTNGRGIFFSAEMKKQGLILRLMAAMAGVSLQDIRNGYLEPADFSKLQTSAQDLFSSQMLLNDVSKPHINYIKSQCYMEHNKKPLEYVMVDYIGLIGAEGESRRIRMGEVSAQLKALAKDLNIPVIALAQLNRETESRTNPRPIMADLKESGDIEQDADLILMLHRPSRYCQKCKELREDCGEHLEYKSRNVNFYHLVEVILEKQRQGPLTTIKTHFDDERQVFKEIDTKTGRLAEVHHG